MGKIVDIRKYPLDTVLFDLHQAAAIKKSWLGKIKDNYWNFLDEIATPINAELNSHIIGDFLTYLDQERSYKTVLEIESNKLSVARGTGVLLMDKEDVDDLIKITQEPNFNSEFYNYSKNLNGENFDFTEEEIERNVTKFLRSLSEVDARNALILNIG